MAAKQTAPEVGGKKASGSKSRVWIVLLVIFGVIAAGFGGYVAYFEHQRTISSCNYVIERLLQTSTFYSNDPYDEDEEEREGFRSKFNEVCGKGYFKKTLAAAFDEYATVGLYNSGFTEGEVEEQRETSYGEKIEVPSVRNRFSKAIGVLGSLGYQDAALRDSAERIFTQGVKQPEANAEASSLLSVVRSMEDNIDKINLWNEGGGDFYHLDLPEHLNEDAVRDVYRQAVQRSAEGGDVERFVRTMESVGESPLMEGVTILQPEEILNLIVPDRSEAELLTLRSGVGGYYDSTANREELTEMLPQKRRSYVNGSDFYGDFYYSSYTSGGNKYDMTEFHNNPGLWAALSPGQRDVITEGNKKTTTNLMYCRGERTECGDIRAYAQAGYRYAYRLGEEGFLYIGDNGISYGSREIPGDFSAIVKELSNEYAASVRAAQAAA